MRRSAQGWQRASHKRVKSAVYRFSLPHSSNLVNPSLLSNCGYSLSTQYIPFLRELIINSKLFQCFMAKYGQQHRDTIPHPHSIAFRHGPIKQKLHMMRAATASPLSFGQKAVMNTKPGQKITRLSVLQSGKICCKHTMMGPSAEIVVSGPYHDWSDGSSRSVGNLVFPYIIYHSLPWSIKWSSLDYLQYSLA